MRAIVSTFAIGAVLSAFLIPVVSAQAASCPPGAETFPGIDFCADCSKDYFNPTGDGECMPCPDGQYSQGGAAQCYEPFPCPIGTEPFRGDCLPCMKNYYGGGGFAFCDQCPDGLESPEGTATIAGCKLELTSPANCSPGFGHYNGDYECTECKRGSFAPGGLDSFCKGCPDGRTPNAEKSSCGECPDGALENADGACEYCPPGERLFYIDPPSPLQACLPAQCNPGNVLPGGTASCEQCPANTYAQDNVRCQSCPPDGISPAGSTGPIDCTPCLYNELAVPGEYRCAPCARDSYLKVDTLTCEICPTGLTAPEGSVGVDSCSKIPCTPPLSLAELETCQVVTCPAGTGLYREGYDHPSDTYECEACQDPQVATVEDGISRCSNCPLGQTSSADVLTCVPCPRNTYGYRTSDPSVNRCYDCPSNKFSRPGSIGKNSCSHVECEVGYVSDPDRGCGSCPIGSAPSPDATVCQPCRENQYGVIGHDTDFNYDYSTCSDCPDGKSSPEGSIGQGSCMLAATLHMGRRAALARVGACDRGLTACLLTSETWECIDITNDLQSCGGCWADGTGEDCTLLLSEDGIEEVKCVMGVCKGEGEERGRRERE